MFKPHIIVGVDFYRKKEDVSLIYTAPSSPIISKLIVIVSFTLTFTRERGKISYYERL